MIIREADLGKLEYVHPDLARVVKRCAKDWKDKTFTWIITCGARTLAEQKMLVKKGASKTLKSRHLIARNGYSHAVDFAPVLQGQVRWDWPLFIKIANSMKAAAIKENVPVEWGGTWKPLNSVKGEIVPQMLHRGFPDGPHFQLPWSTHPGTK